MATKKKIDAATRAKNLKQQENKTPELAAAKKAFQQYFKDNDLDPTKDYTRDPVHGKKITKLLAKLNRERDKVAAQYPETDDRAMKRLEHQAKNKAFNEKKVDKLQKHLRKKVKEDSKKEKEDSSKEGAPKKTREVIRYDYPLIDGREMTSDEKKKYRVAQRKARAQGAPKDNDSSAEPKKSKHAGEPKRSKKFKKKAKKEED